MFLGVDISTYARAMANRACYRDASGQRVDPLSLMRRRGVECVRIRLWNDPRSPDGEPYLAGTCDLANFISLASLARRYNFSVMLDMHLSDFWADPSSQTPPKAWQGLDFDGMCEALYSYTRKTLERIRKAGIELAYIQIGNEITNGMLWPHGRLTGKVDDSDGDGGGNGDYRRGNYESMFRLIAAGTRACREASPDSHLVLHLESSTDAPLYAEYFGAAERYGADYDVIGASYYPWWHGKVDALISNLAACRRFGKQIIICETSYPFTLRGYPLQPGVINAEAVLAVDKSLFEPSAAHADACVWEASPSGQAKFAADLISLSRDNMIDGVIWWEPLWIPGSDVNRATGDALSYLGKDADARRGEIYPNEWANQCFFDYAGHALPVLDTFAVGDNPPKNKTLEYNGV